MVRLRKLSTSILSDMGAVVSTNHVRCEPDNTFKGRKHSSDQNEIVTETDSIDLTSFSGIFTLFCVEIDSRVCNHSMQGLSFLMDRLSILLKKPPTLQGISQSDHFTSGSSSSPISIYKPIGNLIIMTSKLF